MTDGPHASPLGGDHYDKKRRQERPAKRWRDNVDKYLRDTIWQRTAQDRLRHSANHRTLRLPNDDDDDEYDTMYMYLAFQVSGKGI